MQVAALTPLRARLARIAREITELWWTHGPDREHGGFHGQLDRCWRPVPPTDKSAVQQARHLWSLAMWAERRGATPEVEALARGTYDLLRTAFIDPRDGELVFRVTRTGAVVDPTKFLYAQGFGIYGLATYGRVFGCTEAIDRALTCFTSIDARAHDAELGGYRHEAEPEWLDGGGAKGTNTHIHLMEAFTALLDATGDPRVYARTAELVEVVAQRLLQPSGYVHQHFARDFTPVGAPRVSYGHDIETAWLLVDAARALGWPVDRVAEAARRMGEHAVRAGFDAERGGCFDEGIPGVGVTCHDKVWWAQFEALPGLYWLYRLTGEAVYLGELERALAWLEGPGRDAEHGEWYFAIAADGRPTARGDHKGELWKTTYHGLRAVVYLEDWLSAQAGAERTRDE